MVLERLRADDIGELTTFLTAVDLTLSGFDSPGIRLWLERDASGAVIGSTGYELSDDSRDALIRSVAVDPDLRAEGKGSLLARFALQRAAAERATRAWLFSRRSGPFWQQLGFRAADRKELAHVLQNTHQVTLFRSTGQLDREVAWSMPLPTTATEAPERADLIPR